jgi:hypothetical protein
MGFVKLFNWAKAKEKKVVTGGNVAENQTMSKNSRIFFFFGGTWLELKAYILSHSTSLFCVCLMGVFEIGFSNYLPRLALNHNPPDLCLLSH